MWAIPFPRTIHFLTSHNLDTKFWPVTRVYLCSRHLSSVSDELDSLSAYAYKVKTKTNLAKYTNFGKETSGLLGVYNFLVTSGQNDILWANATLSICRAPPSGTSIEPSKYIKHPASRFRTSQNIEVPTSSSFRTSQCIGHRPYELLRASNIDHPNFKMHPRSTIRTFMWTDHRQSFPWKHERCNFVNN